MAELVDAPKRIVLRVTSHVNLYTGSNPVLTTKIKIMENEKWWNGFLLGFFIGGIVGIIVLNLVQKGIL